MKNVSLILLCFIVCFILSSAVQSNTPSPAPSPSQGGEEQLKQDTHKKIIYIAVITTLLIAIAFVSFAVLRVRAKLKQADSHRKPLTNLASKNAGIIFDERSSDEDREE